MPEQSDLELNRAVRRVFVKHWVDLGRISVRSAKGNVLIRGRLMRIAGTKDELTTPITEHIFEEIQRIKGVRRLTVNLDNWIKEGGFWRPYERYAAKVDY